MGVAIPAGYAALVYEFTCSGTSHRPTFTMGVKPDPALTVGEIANLGQDAITASGSLCTAATMITGWALVGVHATLMTESGPLVGENSSPIVGTGGGDALPINCALLITKNTARGGRKGRGRFFLPPFTVSEGGVNNVGTIGSGDVAALQAKTDTFWSVLDGSDIPAWLMHEDGTIPNEITSFTVQNTIATQRRRLR